VGIWLRIITIKVWDHVTIFHLFVEFFFAVGEAGSLLGGIPFLGALAVASFPVSHGQEQCSSRAQGAAYCQLRK